MVRSSYYPIQFLITSLCAVLLFLPILRPSLSRAESTKPKALPNIVIIMADDLGFSDLGCYGSEIETPHLDELAAGGIRYLGFYNTARCCPSRASLMTGKYAHRVQMGWMTAVDEHRPGYRGQLSFDHPTIAELLWDSGYRTCMSGKWHLTVDENHRNPKAIPNGSWPTQRGFVEFFGGLTGGGNYFRPTSLARNLKRIPKESLPEGYYYTNEITKHAVQFIRDAPKDKPLFLYVAHYAPHRPLQAPAPRIARCRARYQVGCDEIRKRRFAKQQQLGLFEAELTLSEPGLRLPNQSPSWEELGKNRQEKWIEEMATYAAMVEIMDDGVGEIVFALETKGILENTLILFLSDNGATKEGGLLARLRGDVCNTPYRNYKQYTHLGGVASPLIAYWPNCILDAGAIQQTRAHIIDILPTCLDVIDKDYPQEFNSQPIQGPDGVSLAGTFEGLEPADRALFWEHQSSRAVMKENWRLVSLSSDDPWELYDVSSDPFEQVDLSEANESLTLQLSKLWLDWADSTDVLPLENRPWNRRIRHYRKLAAKHTNQ